MTWSVFSSKTDFCSHSSILRCLFWSSNPFTHIVVTLWCMASDCWAMLGPCCIPIGFMDCMPCMPCWFIPRQPFPLWLGIAGMPLPPGIGIAGIAMPGPLPPGPLPPGPSAPDMPLPPGGRFCPLGAWCRIGLWQGIYSRKLTVELDYTPRKIYKNDEFLGFILVFGGVAGTKTGTISSSAGRTKIDHTPVHRKHDDLERINPRSIWNDGLSLLLGGTRHWYWSVTKKSYICQKKYVSIWCIIKAWELEKVQSKKTLA